MEKTAKNNLNTKKRKKLIYILVLITLVISFIFIRGKFLTYLEIGEKYVNVFNRNLIYILIFALINFIFLYLVFIKTNKIIKDILAKFYETENKKVPKIPNKSISFILALIGSTVVTILLYNKLVPIFGFTWFGTTDPIYNMDLSWFVFVKPLVIDLIFYLIIVTVFSLIYGVGYSIYFLNTDLGGISRESFKSVDILNIVKTRVRIIAILIGLLILFNMVANIGNEKFFSINLPDGNTYSLYGANYTDGILKKWGYLLFAIIAVFSLFKIYKSVKEGSIRRTIGYVLVVPIYLISLAIIMAIFNGMIIGNNNFEKNEWYISKNIEMTKNAYNLNYTKNDIDYSGKITEKEIRENANLINNIGIVDKESVLQDLKFSQTEKGYYSYNKTQIQKYNIDGSETLVYITPREISNDNSTYSNKTYQYTHGYGIVVTSAGKVEDNGYLKTIQKEFGDLSNSKIKINEPRIYYGLSTNDTIVVGDNNQEFDYIEETDKIIKNQYNGNGGLSLNIFDRLIVASIKGDFKLAFLGNKSEKSKYLFNRNILNRAKSILPYIIYDQNPYMIIDENNELNWVIDGYTSTNDHPFSQKIVLENGKEVNYLKNSVKVIVNAYNGDMKFYITDRNDPIIMAYNKAYPGLFEEKENGIPEYSSKQFIYPKYLFDIQKSLIEIYHTNNASEIFRANDIWNVTKKGENIKNAVGMDSYYTMLKDSTDDISMGIMIPFSNYDKQNISAYLVGTIENGNQVLRINVFPQDQTVIGPIELDTQINQDEQISSDIASLNVSGTKIIRKIIIVPIGNTLLYVEPIYQQLLNETTQKPQLKRVVVASGNKVGYGEKFESAINNLISKKAVDLNIINTKNTEELIKELIKYNNDIKQSGKSGNWKLLGEDLERLINLIDKIEKESEEKSTTTYENNSNTTVNN